MIGRPRRRPAARSTVDDATIPLPSVGVPHRVSYHAPPWRPMSKQGITDLHYGMKRAMSLANEASERWAERSNFVNAYCDSKGMDVVQRMSYRSDDVWLSDALRTWSFFEREVRRYGDMIAAEYRMRQMMSTEDGEMSDSA